MVNVDSVPSGYTPNSVVLYGKSNCRYCDLAVELATQKGLTVTYRSLTTPEHFKFIVEERGYKTVPQIWVTDEDNNTRYIGGYNEFRKLFNYGEQE